MQPAARERAVSEAGRKAYAARLSILRDKLVADGFARPRAEGLAAAAARSRLPHRSWRD
ncbi:hypothetical protein [Bradyrhizobium agreste]|uniref:hypothetical protein n=1 Tax=Bradyrhizobium agreste TaxID=2751811 RepID=UPI001FECA0F9|nr:hypothetical protein [Bradyrhizobium agreste]